MLYSTEYQRYKQKLERLQQKMKKGETTRRELESNFRKLMKERNDCEQSANVYKFKYDALMKHECERLNRNEELLQHLQNVHEQANRMASNTERLKKLKMQQEFIMINNLRQNAFLQQRLIYTTPVLSLPAPSSLSLNEHKNSTLDTIQESGYSYPIITGRSAYYTEKQRPAFQNITYDDKSVNAIITTQPGETEIYPSISHKPVFLNDMNPRFIEELRYLQDGKFPLRYLDTQYSVPQPQILTSKSVFDKEQAIRESGFGNHYSENAPAKNYLNQVNNDLSDGPYVTMNHNKYLTSTFASPNISSHSKQQQSTSSIQPFDLTSGTHLQHNEYPRSPISEQKEIEKSLNASYSIISPKTDLSFLNVAKNEVHEPSKSDGIRKDTISNNILPGAIRKEEVHVPKYAEQIDLQHLAETGPLSREMENNSSNRYNLPIIPTIASDSKELSKMDDLKDIFIRDRSNSTTVSIEETSKADPKNSSEISYGIDRNDEIENSAKDLNKRRSSIDYAPIEFEYQNDMQEISVAAHRRYSEAVNSLTSLQQNIPTAEAIPLTTMPSSLSAMHNIENSRKNIETKQYIDPNSNKESFDGYSYNTDENKSMTPHCDMEYNRIQTNPTNRDDINQNEAYSSVQNTSFPEEALQDDYSAHVNVSNGDYNESTNFDTVQEKVNDQIFVENAMEKLHLENIAEPSNETKMEHIESEINTSRSNSIHGKTVTWADDFDENIKKYEKPLMPDETVDTLQNVDSYQNDVTENIQSEYSSQQYTNVNSGAGIDADPNNSYIYDASQLQMQEGDATDPNMYENNYYYPDQESNQYDQYALQQPNEDPQNLQYYANETEENPATANFIPESYPQNEMQLQAPVNQDQYYNVTPGENYYNEYEEPGQHENYTINPNESSFGLANTPILEQQQLHQTEIESLINNEQTNNVYVTNYLQSDTDDSQIDYQNITNNNIIQNQESDFDFSTNS